MEIHTLLLPSLPRRRQSSFLLKILHQSQLANVQPTIHWIPDLVGDDNEGGGCDFLDADMSGADLSHAFIQQANFENTDLRGATLEGFDLSGVRSFQNMKVSESQQSILLHSLGIRVFP